MTAKHIVILCDGEAPPRSLLSEACRRAGLFIAADGAGNTALDYRIPPDVVIGDLDSFDTPPHNGPELIHDADQETNDLEKALNLALRRGGTHVTVFGATGKRVDHTLKNLSVLKQFTPRFTDLCFRDRFGTTRMLPGEYTIDRPAGTPVSLFPLSGRVEGIVTEGLKYPLNNEPLENGVRDGSSNEVSRSPARVRYQNGDLLIFIGDTRGRTI